MHSVLCAPLRSKDLARAAFPSATILSHDAHRAASPLLHNSMMCAPRAAHAPAFSSSSPLGVPSTIGASAIARLAALKLASHMFSTSAAAATAASAAAPQQQQSVVPGATTSTATFSSATAAATSSTTMSATATVSSSPAASSTTAATTATSPAAAAAGKRGLRDVCFLVPNLIDYARIGLGLAPLLMPLPSMVKMVWVLCIEHLVRSLFWSCFDVVLLSIFRTATRKLAALLFCSALFRSRSVPVLSLAR